MILVAAGVLLILAGAPIVVALRRWPGRAGRAYLSVFLAGCLSAVVPAAAVLGGGVVREFRIATNVPGGPWVFGLDSLSALFVLAIAGVGGSAAIYGVSYLQGGRSPTRVALAHANLALLVAALMVVVTARAAVPFLIAWELMAIAAYLLIVHEADRPDVRHAGLLYLVATHAGTLALFALFALWANGAADLTFASLAQRAPLPAAQATVLLVLAFFGFGMKAGLVPLHFWLPSAHAAAPSHVSALLSGVMIKMGIYGLMRVIALLGAPPVWAGWVLVAAGVVSGLLGVIWALTQHELKRLLAYHSVENIGIILLGLGSGVLGLSYGHPVVAVLGFAGAALHTMNHALFKSLLFLGAGSVIHATANREIDRLGGLARSMPVTASAFLVGSVAIVGLPPLNGFVSEWLVMRSLLSGATFADRGRIAVVAVAGLALIGALALACFAKVTGILFLGSARARPAGTVHESPSAMVAPMIALAGACIAIGMAPVLVLPAIGRVARLLAGLPAGTPAGITDAAPATALSILLAAGFLLAGGLTLRIRNGRSRLEAATWGCGHAPVTPRMQYTASSFAAPLLLAFRSVAGVRVTRTAEEFATHARDPVLEGVVFRASRWVRATSARLRPIQRGRLSLYLLYVVVTLVALLGWLLLAGAP
jgi:hydrogenase-4 component B